MMAPRMEALELHLAADGQPELDQNDAIADEARFKQRYFFQELGGLRFAAETHDPLDAGAVVPGAVEQDHVAGGGEMLHIALEVPSPRSVSVGLVRATARAWRGLRCCMNLLMVPPLPAASRPSNRMTTRCRSRPTQR